MKLVPPGIDWRTGQLLPPLPDLADLAAAVRGAPALGSAGFQKFALPAGMPAQDLAKTGWAVVWPDGAGSIREMLAPLLERRKKEAGAFFRELMWTRSDQNARAWLKRNFAGTTVDPGKVPYYLLVVGPPTGLSFEAQYELAKAGYAVGRLDLGSAPDAWRRYAEGVCTAETRTPWKPRRLGVWAPRQDDSTRASHDQFALPLAFGPAGAKEDWERAAADVCGFSVEMRSGAAATKQALLDLLCDTPPLLLTASHGIGVASGTGDPLALQGALLAQDWCGIGGPRREDVVTSEDLVDALDVRGLVALVMACYGAGTSRQGSFPWPAAQASEEARYHHGTPFVAALPQKLLAHPRGPALAVLGHVDRAYAWSFAPVALGERNGAFRTFLIRLMQGERVGHAAAELWIRCNALGSRLADMLAPDAPLVDDEELAAAWIEFRDGRNYVLLGDPAARLCATTK